LKKKQETEIHYPLDIEPSPALKKLLDSTENLENLKLEIALKTIFDFPVFYKKLWARASIHQILQDLLDQQ